MTSFGPPPGFTPPSSSSGDDGGGNGNNNGGYSISGDHPWAWVLIPVAVLISLGTVAACLHTSRRRRRAARLAHENAMSNRVRNGRLSSPHLSPSRRPNRRRDRDRDRDRDVESDRDFERGLARDLEAAYVLSQTRSTRWWSLPPPHRPRPEEGLNELGEAPPPYEKGEPIIKRDNGSGAGGDGGVVEMQELPPDNEIAELDAGESSSSSSSSSRPRLVSAGAGAVVAAAAAAAVEIDGEPQKKQQQQQQQQQQQEQQEQQLGPPKEMDATTAITTNNNTIKTAASGKDLQVAQGADEAGEDRDQDQVQYDQAYAVTITSGTASRTESPASWTSRDDGSQLGEGGGVLSTGRRSLDGDSSSSINRSSSRAQSIPPGYEHARDVEGDDDHVYNVVVEEVREAPVDVLQPDQSGHRKGA